MEKQKIKSVEPKQSSKGTKYVVVKTFEGKSGTCWDVGYMEILKQSIGQDVLISIVENEKGYQTVVELCPLDQKTPRFENPPEPVAIENNSTNSTKKSGLSFRDEVIIGQVILKEASNLACVVASNKEMTPEEYGEVLSNAVNQLTGAYKLALHNLSIL